MDVVFPTVFKEHFMYNQSGVKTITQSGSRRSGLLPASEDMESRRRGAGKAHPS